VCEGQSGTGRGAGLGRGEIGISTAASVAAGPSDGLFALRRGPLGRAIVAIGLSALVGVYVLPLARALTLPARPLAQPLQALTVPVYDFPRLNPPRAAAPAAAAPARPFALTTHRTRTHAAAAPAVHRVFRHRDHSTSTVELLK
jgi:hypothetical protein